MVNYSLHPICDTNILIDLQLGNVFQEFLESTIKVNVADKVKDEMNNKFSKSQKYKFLLDVFEKNNIQIIEESIFSEDALLVMRANLAHYNVQNFIGRRAFGKDAGEFASALYAVNLGIRKLYTNDKKFITNYGQEQIFSGLEMLNLNYTLEEFLKHTERISAISKIENENSKMISILQKEASEKKEKDSLEKLLKKLAEKYS